MFDYMNDGETGLYVGHSPGIQLAAWLCNGTTLAHELRTLAELDAIVFKATDEGFAIRAVRKIPYATTVAVAR